MGKGSLSDLAARLATEPAALHEIMVMLERKGRVRRLLGNSNCGSCTKCDPAQSEVYEWVV